ncbi:MAG: HNH endonuclease [Deltaproteobacteria bacterium]|nr:HNH endonuclease [Deltaproteobacteria bacterium]MBM4316538.1 HNH endonuclease [Deltaproteobacteria bacterium]
MHHTLLLNAGFEPLRVVSWQRAFILIFQEKVEILEEYSTSIHTVNCSFKIPAVIRLRRWVNLKKYSPVIRFSRANLYARDEYCCQYCYKTFNDKDLTMDHVYPAVKGGKKTWENIVSACVKCNQRKSDKSPEEVGMKLLKKPRIPTWLPGFNNTLQTRSAHSLWEPYLRFMEKGFSLASN